MSRKTIGNFIPEDEIFKNLNYIKKYKKYPLSKSILRNIVFWSIAILILFIGNIYIIVDSLLIQGKPYFNVLSPVLLILIISGFLKYLNSLKFIEVKTPFSKELNRVALLQYLNLQGLWVTQHAKTKDILQIMSRPIPTHQKQRELMFFIIDEKRILINSHFSNINSLNVKHKLHHKLFANQFKKWLHKFTSKDDQSIVHVG